MAKELIDMLEAALEDSGIGPHSGHLLAQFFNGLPFPAWVKIVQPCGQIAMARVNKEYEHAYGLTTEDIIAREQSATLAEISEWEVNDRRALRKNERVQAVEKITFKGEKEPRTCLVYKWPAKIPDGWIVCGVAIPVGGAF